MWVLDLEEMKVKFVNSKSMPSHQEDLAVNGLSNILGNDQLLEKWKGLFSVNDCLVCLLPSDDVASLVVQLFKEVVTCYVKMGVGEYLREFRREFQLHKTEAHRKKGTERKKTKDLASSKITIESIKGDSSAEKRNSPQRLQAMVIQHGQILQSSVYTKGEVQLLCKAYGVSDRRSDSEANLSEKLGQNSEGSTCPAPVCPGGRR